MIDLSVPIIMPDNIEQLMETVFLTLLLGISIVFLFTKNLLNSICLMIAFSLSMSIMYLLMAAPDVAMTEAAVGAAITTVITLCALTITDNKNETSTIKLSKLGILLIIILGMMLIYAAGFMPKYGDFAAPIHNHVAPYYITQTSEQIGIKSAVAAILASYRGFDTLGETSVILIAGLAVYMILGKNLQKSAIAIFQKDIYVTMLAKIIIPVITIFALYIQVFGETSPGGGFQAGAIISSGFIFYALATSSQNILSHFSFNWFKNTAILGVMIYTTTGLAAFYFGENFLNYSILSNDAVSGQKLGIFIIEIGVGITVFSVLTAIFLLYSKEGENC